MWLLWQQFKGIARQTALEGLRQPFTLLLTTVVASFIQLLPFMIAFSFGEAGKLIRDSGLASMWTGGLILSVYVAGSGMDREIRRGGAASLLSKPVHRGVFILSKWAGSLLVLLLYALISGLFVITATRTSMPHFSLDLWSGIGMLLIFPLAYLSGAVINFTTRRSFPASTQLALAFFAIVAFIFLGFTSAKGWQGSWSGLYDSRILPALVLIGIALVLLQSIATAMATRLALMPCLMGCAMIFFFGLISDYALGRFAEEHLWAKGFYYLTPNWQHFWLADALTGGGTIPWSYVGQTLLYVTGYLVGILWIGYTLFHRSEVS